MKARAAASSEYTKFLSYEIFDTQRFTNWSIVAGVMSGALAVAAAVTAETPSELAGKCTLSVLIFASAMLMGLRAEDRDVKKARAYGRNSVFNAYRQMFPELVDSQQSKPQGGMTI